jgi:hypothetical protein
MTRHVERVYCLARCADDRWLVLNRKYKPFGTGRTGWVNYDECDGIRIWLRERDIRMLDGSVVPYQKGDAHVWLYSDATDPHLGGTHLRAYEQRLGLLDLAKSEEAA